MGLKTRQIRGLLYHLACPQRVLAKIDGKMAIKWSNTLYTFSKKSESSWYTFCAKIFKRDKNSAKNSSKSKIEPLKNRENQFCELCPQTKFFELLRSNWYHKQIFFFFRVKIDDFSPKQFKIENRAVRKSQKSILRVMPPNQVFRAPEIKLVP